MKTPKEMFEKIGFSEDEASKTLVFVSYTNNFTHTNICKRITLSIGDNDKVDEMYNRGTLTIECVDGNTLVLNGEILGIIEDTFDYLVQEKIYKDYYEGKDI